MRLPTFSTERLVAVVSHLTETISVAVSPPGGFGVVVLLSVILERLLEIVLLHFSVAAIAILKILAQILCPGHLSP